MRRHQTIYLKLRALASMRRLRLFTAALRRFGLPKMTVPWRRPLPVIGNGPAAASAAIPAFFFLFSYLVFLALFSTLKNVDKVKWAAAVHSSTFRAMRLANATAINTTSQEQQQNITCPRPPGSSVILKQQQNDSQDRSSDEYPIHCSIGENRTDLTCPARYYPAAFESKHVSPTLGMSQEMVACPDYFRWIHDDLRPWRDSGITREMVERARRTAHFRLVIINGRVYVEQFRKSIQTRDLFTIWGILQLLRRYPGRVPDLELMFDCDDRPVILSRDYRAPNSTGAPPLFRYCGDRWMLDIVFPDWSFWGWAEINIRPWEKLLQDLKEGNDRTRWTDREPYAYWKGNPFVAASRRDLLRCNISESHDWNARLFVQDWIRESREGYKQSDLASQCTHRYKIYIEGYAWSVSEKYILACDSMTLLVKPHFYDFFTRSLEPLRHYWPVREDDKCRSIEFAVQWGNSQHEASAIGRAAAAFVQEQVKMDYVYDYMLRLLTEYSKLMRFEPSVPEGATEVCSEGLGCSAANGPQRDFMMESLVKGPLADRPCDLPPPFDPKACSSLWRKSQRHQEG